jgi:hypothetical protein
VIAISRCSYAALTLPRPAADTAGWQLAWPENCGFEKYACQVYQDDVMQTGVSCSSVSFLEDDTLVYNFILTNPQRLCDSHQCHESNAEHLDRR